MKGNLVLETCNFSVDVGMPRFTDRLLPFRFILSNGSIVSFSISCFLRLSNDQRQGGIGWCFWRYCNVICPPLSSGSRDVQGHHPTGTRGLTYNHAPHATCTSSSIVNLFSYPVLQSLSWRTLCMEKKTSHCPVA
jgi:hypothetical protein